MKPQKSKPSFCPSDRDGRNLQIHIDRGASTKVKEVTLSGELGVKASDAFSALQAMKGKLSCREFPEHDVRRAAENERRVGAPDSWSGRQCILFVYALLETLQNRVGSRTNFSFVTRRRCIKGELGKQQEDFGRGRAIPSPMQYAIVL